MNILNEPELRRWLSVKVDYANIRPNFKPRIQQWVMTCYRRWFMRQEQHFRFVEHTVVDPMCVPIFFGTKREPIPIESVFSHMKAKKLDYVYEITVHYQTPGVTPNTVTTHVRNIIVSRHWQWRMLAEGNYHLWMVPVHYEHLGNIIDWMAAHEAELPTDLSRFSVEHAIERSDGWHNNMYERMLGAFRFRAEHYEHIEIDKSDPGKRVLIPTLRGQVHEMLDRQALLYEHVDMHHCVNTYWPKVERGDCRLLHIEYQAPTDSKPQRATCEIQKDRTQHFHIQTANGERWHARLEQPKSLWKVTQLRGPCNHAVSDEIRQIAEHACAYINANESVNTEHKPNNSQGEQHV